GVRDSLRLASIGATMDNLNAGVVARLRVPLPPVLEQEQIVTFANLEERRWEKSLLVAEREIELLREYRTRLVEDVVTGKLDVRAAARSLPEEAGLSVAPAEAAADGIDNGEELEAEDDIPTQGL